MQPDGCTHHLEPQLSSSLPTIHHARETPPEQSGCSQSDAGSNTPSCNLATIGSLPCKHLGASTIIEPANYPSCQTDAARAKRMQEATHHLIYNEYCLYPKFGHKIPLIINTSRIRDATNHLEPQLSSSLPTAHRHKIMHPQSHKKGVVYNYRNTTPNYHCRQIASKCRS